MSHQSGNGFPSPNGDSNLEAPFASLIADQGVPKAKPVASKFVKKLDEIPEIALPPTLPRKATISLAERGLVGQFTSLWPSPRAVQKWVERNWSANIHGKIAIRFYGRGYYTFLFESKEDRNLIFRNGPYFMDSRGLYLNRWSLDFDLDMDIANAVPIWVRLPHLPLHCWGDESVKAIRNAVGKYIDRCEPKDNMHACARICVEVDLGRGLPEAIKLRVDQWTQIQQLDYEKIPFKCKVCHDYGHFPNRCSKLKDAEIVENVETQENNWEQVKRKKTSNKQNTQNPPQENENTATSSLPLIIPAPPVEPSSNPFELLEDDPPSPHSPPQPNANASASSPPPNFSPPPPFNR